MEQLLTTKLHIPSVRSELVHRPRLIEKMNEGLRLGRKLTIISAPAGFGKTTLISEWIAGCERPIAWLSLDEGDSDPARFLTYFVAVIQTLKLNNIEGTVADIGKEALGALQSPQPPSIESILTILINEIAEVDENFVLVLDDYHIVDSKAVDKALEFLLEHLPQQMHLVIATREDPHLQLARLRAQGQLTELRVANLRFTDSEAAEFLNQVMGLTLSAEDVSALETRTEGWIAGLQLAALSMQGDKDTAGFIRSFTGSNRFVLDYLVEEVLARQPERVQAFLLHTSILNRMCGELCDAVLRDSSLSGQETLERLEKANLFIVPLDNERRWYRYHHLFAELLRQRLQQSIDTSPSVAELHIRASVWYEENGLEIESFHHAARANDIERAARLVQGKGIPLHLRGALVPVVNWLESLPKTVLDEKPILWILNAGALTAAGQTIGVEQKLQAAETALQGAELNSETRDLLGRIANNRATLAISQYQPDEAIMQAQRALEYLRPDNLPVRTITTWVLGTAYQFKGDRVAAGQAFTNAISISKTINQTFVTKLATVGLGDIQEMENRLYLAAETYQHAIELFGDQPLPFASEAHLGLARIFYEWNNLDAARFHGQQSVQLARQYADIIDRYIICEIFLARLMLTQGDVAGAAALLNQTDQSARKNKFIHRIPDVVAAQVMVLLHQDNLEEAAHLAKMYDLPESQVRVYLSQGDTSSALAVLESWRQQMEAKDWRYEQLKAMVLQAVVLYAHGEQDKAIQVLEEALVLAEPGGFIRIFIDEGKPIAELLTRIKDEGLKKYAHKLLDAIGKQVEIHPSTLDQPSLTEPLSPREMEVLRLIAQGLSNDEIGKRLYLALDTVKGHNRKIFDKLQVQRRTEAVARARELGLL